MKSRKLAMTTTAICCLILALGLFGCSSNSPLSPSNQQTEVGVSDVNQAAVTANVAQTGTAPVAALDAIQHEMGGELIEASAISFLGVIGTVSTEESTIQFWNQDNNFTVVIGHVTAATELLDGDGNPVQITDFSVCFQAQVTGEEIGENELELTSVIMVPF